MFTICVLYSSLIQLNNFCYWVCSNRCDREGCINLRGSSCLSVVCSIDRLYHWTIFSTVCGNRFDRSLCCPLYVSSEHFFSRCCQRFSWSSVVEQSTVIYESSRLLSELFGTRIIEEVCLIWPFSHYGLVWDLCLGWCGHRVLVWDLCQGCCYLACVNRALSQRSRWTKQLLYLLKLVWCWGKQR